jgi:uncharacterized repeat protein (TIGR02543 family)
MESIMKNLRIPAAILLSCILASCSNNILSDPVSKNESRKAETVRIVTFYCQNATPGSPETIITKTLSGSQSTLEAFPNEPSKQGYIFAGWWTKPNGEGTSFLPDTVVASNLSVYAKWSNQPVYHVSFMTYGGTPVSVRKVTQNAKLDSPGNPTKQGYLFGGWFREESCSTPWNFTTDVVTGDLALHAKWDTYSWSVTFVDAAGAGADAVLVVSSPAWTTGKLPPHTAKGTLHFAGWWTAKDGKGTQFTSTTPVYSDVSLYPWWTTKQVYTLAFDAQGGTAVGNRSVTEGSFPSEPDATAKDGYEFGGWYSEPDGKGKPFSLTASVSSDKTWYACWKAYSFTVTFDSDGATVPARPETIAVQSPVFTVGSLPAGAPAKDGYVFSGWFTERNGEGIQFTETTRVTQDLSVYAAWKGYEYTVTFDIGQDSAQPMTMTVASPLTALPSLPPDPERAGYAFGGWFTERDGKGARFDVTTKVASNVRVYASWLKACVVSFNPNGGTGSMKDLTVRLGESAILTRNAFSRAGFTFAGWALSSYGTRAYDEGASVSPTSSSLPLFATWKINSYTVSFEPNGGDGKMSPITMEYNKITTLNPVKFTRDGYSFAGWAQGANDPVVLPNLGVYAMGAENARLYAVWKYSASTGDRMFSWTTSDGKIAITGFSGEWNAGKGTSIVLPNVINGYPVTTVARGAFAESPELASIDAAPGNAFFRSKDGVLFTSDMTVLIAYPAAKKSASYAVPDSVATIAPQAFKNVKYLEAVSLGQAVITIGDGAFAGCDSLVKMAIAAQTPPELASSALPAGKRITVEVPAQFANAYESASGWKTLMSENE